MTSLSVNNKQCSATQTLTLTPFGANRAAKGRKKEWNQNDKCHHVLGTTMEIKWTTAQAGVNTNLERYEWKYVHIYKTSLWSKFGVSQPINDTGSGLNSLQMYFNNLKCDSNGIKRHFCEAGSDMFKLEVKFLWPEITFISNWMWFWCFILTFACWKASKTTFCT